MTGRAIEDEAQGQASVALLDPPAADERLAPAGTVGGAEAAQRARALWRRAATLLMRDAVRVPLTVFLLSRAYIFLLGAIAMEIDKALPPVAALGYYMPQMPGLAHYLLQPWRNWDGHWFSLIAQAGYFERPTTAFFPLYPLL